MRKNSETWKIKPTSLEAISLVGRQIYINNFTRHAKIVVENDAKRIGERRINFQLGVVIKEFARKLV